MNYQLFVASVFWPEYSYISKWAKNWPTHEPATRLREKFLSLMRHNLFMGVNEMRVKSITVTVSVRVSVMVRVSLGWFVSSKFGGVKCRHLVTVSIPCVRTVNNRWLVMTVRMRTVHNTLHAYIDRAYARSATPC